MPTRNAELGGMQTEFPPVAVPTGWLAALSAFQRHQVQFVVAGPAAAAIVAGEPDPEMPLVIAPAPFRRNLEHLSAALAEIGVRLRGASGRSQPLEASRIANHPSVLWHIYAGTTPVDIIGSAVGDGEFSIRLWRTKPIELKANDHAVTCEVELATDRAAVTA